MASVNKAIILGHAGRDTEVRYLPSGVAVANVSIATTSRRKDKSSGETLEETQWHRVTFYERLAEIAGEYVKKGRPVYVEGRIKYGKFTNKDGVEQNTCDIVAESLQLLGEGKRETAPAAPKSEPKRQAGGSGFDDMDSDIPFTDPLKRRAFCMAI